MLKLLKGAGRAGIIGLLGLLVWQGWEIVRPRRPAVGAARIRLADRVAERAMFDIESALSRRKLVVLPLVGDDAGVLTAALRRSLEEHGHFEMLQDSALERIRDRLQLPVLGVADREKALEIAAGAGADAVLIGEISEYAQRRDYASLRLTLAVFDAETGEPIFEREYAERSPRRVAVPGAVGRRLDRLPFLARFAVWVVMIALIPLAAMQPLRRWAARESNAVNGWILGVFTLFGGVAGDILFGFSTGGSVRVALCVFAAVTAFLYIVWVLTAYTRLEA